MSLPSPVGLKWPLFQHLHYELRNWLGETAAFMPDCFFAPDGTVCLDERPSPYHRFQAFFRSLLTLQPLALSEVDAASFSTYSMRRLLPSVADCLQLSDAERNCLGNWQDGYARDFTNKTFLTQTLGGEAGREGGWDSGIGIVDLHVGHLGGRLG